MKRWLPFCIALFSIAAAALPSQKDQGKIVSIGQAAEQAVQLSKLTVDGGTPFHLKANIARTTNSYPAFTAEIEEYWVSPAKWRRTVKSADFSQTLIVNGDKTSEQLTGDYYPFWLHDLVTALFDPLPMAEQLKAIHGQLEIPEDSAKSNSCMNMQSKVGVAPVQSSVTFNFCFGGKMGLVQAVITPAYRAQFADYQAFKNKMVARSITATFAPDTTISAKITELSELSSPDETLFAIDKETPAAEQIKSIQVGENTARLLALNTPAIEWPAVREGKISGVISLYISCDRTGKVREVWPLSSGNPELNDALREQLLRWQYKPYNTGGASQMEAVLTFAFNTRIENPIPVLNDAEARKQASHAVEPIIPAGKARPGTKFGLRVSVNEAGKVVAVLNPNNVPQALYAAGATALKKWNFRSFLNQGKPDRFYADITFQVRRAQ
ncbi:MAG TPA: hypothetical protein VGJ33_20555 [Candidatus Angelobacter sp.]|jgi:hypothetical protein